MPNNPPDIKQFSGRPLEEYLGALSGWLKRNQPAAAKGGLLREHRGPRGVTLSLATRDIGWIKLTGRSGSAYSWTRQIATAGGGWSDDSTLSGTTSVDPAYEANGLTATTPYKVWAWRDGDTGEVRFSNGKC